jgi:hypothetical protein
MVIVLDRIGEYVQKLFRNVPASARRDALMQEVTQDLEEKMADLMQQGKAEEDAFNKAVVDFGDIGELRRELQDNSPVKVKTARLSTEFALCGSLLIIGLCLFVNLYYTPGVIWFVYPAFGVLWWPLAMCYRWLRLKRRSEGESERGESGQL